MKKSVYQKLSKLHKGFWSTSCKLATSECKSCRQFWRNANASDAEVLSKTDAQPVVNQQEQCSPDKCWDCSNTLC